MIGCFTDKYRIVWHWQVNYCVAQKACDQCKDGWSVDVLCGDCGEDRELIFEGEDTLDEFCRWLFQEKHKHYVVSSPSQIGE
jgi:hypothetical protein